MDKQAKEKFLNCLEKNETYVIVYAVPKHKKERGTFLFNGHIDRKARFVLEDFDIVHFKKGINGAVRIFVTPKEV